MIGLRVACRHLFCLIIVFAVGCGPPDLPGPAATAGGTGSAGGSKGGNGGTAAGNDAGSGGGGQGPDGGLPPSPTDGGVSDSGAADGGAGQEDSPPDPACESVADGSPCDDADSCTQGDSCQGGRCVGEKPARESLVCDGVDDDCDGIIDEDCTFQLRGTLKAMPSRRSPRPEGGVLHLQSADLAIGASANGSFSLRTLRVTPGEAP